MSNPDIEFDFVISYAGENSSYAEALYNELTKGDAKVFYAPQSQAEIWGQNLYEYLADIYSKKGLFCIPLISTPYVQKQWTRREWSSAQERALKEVDRAYILPVRIDDTDLPGLLGTIAYQDVRTTSIEQIAQLALAKLRQHLNGREIALDAIPPAIEPMTWEYSRLPFQRSSFLLTNNYLDPKSETFAVNKLSSALVDYNGETVSRFLALVAIPIPEAIDQDIDELPEKLFLDGRQYQIGREDKKRPWLEFGLGDMLEKQTTRTDYIRFVYRGKRNPDKNFQAEQYLRYSEDGGIESVDGIYSNYSYKEWRVFDFINILGTAIRFINLAAFTYTVTGYLGRLQFLINLVGTENSILGEFATDTKTKVWRSPVSSASAALHFAMDGQQGRTSELNLQFAYNIDTKTLFDNPDSSFDIMIDLSRKLQRSYNYSYKDRHYIPETDEFPWQQYYQRLRY